MTYPLLWREGEIVSIVKLKLKQSGGSLRKQGAFFDQDDSEP